jgi:hypothetical protein
MLAKIEFNGELYKTNDNAAPDILHITGVHFVKGLINSASRTFKCSGNTKILCLKKSDPAPIMASRPRYPTKIAPNANTNNGTDICQGLSWAPLNVV